MFQLLEQKGYDLITIQHAKAIIENEFPFAVQELVQVIEPIQIPIAELVFGGGGKTKIVKRMEQSFFNLGWQKHNFDLKKLADGKVTQAISHEIDHVKHFENGTIALEIEWNNKDPFFDRDLQNFRNLHADGAISLGIIITRGATLQQGIKDKIIEFANKNGIASIDDLSKYYIPTSSQKKAIKKKTEAIGNFTEAWADRFVSSKFGQSTTHWDKLVDRVNRGVGNPCPLILIGIPISVISG